MEVSVKDPLVATLLDEFMEEYREEVGRTSLQVTVLDILRAQKTTVREELEEDLGDRFDSGGQEKRFAQQFRLYALLDYHFQSTMFEAKRPYISVLRLTMDCVNTTYGDEPANFACDVTQHLDLPRKNISSAHVPADIQKAIFENTPREYISRNGEVQVHFDALEEQDLYFDASPQLQGMFTCQYVRYRVRNAANAQDCMVVLSNIGDRSKLLYTDSACYREDIPQAATVADYRITKQDFPMILLIVSLIGCFVSMVVLLRQRTQRKGYAYLSSSTSKLSHVPTSDGMPGTTDATAPGAA
ncbi:TPA: hypothetical protein N0F65_007835 [Lagenidium giganteum]|uniref:Uncharacterized protein n=1 Tax=Lagenidium giganteum TaxID=4803 RepID=A0AAV2Z388_9STRA|nr:TPA: hypothetical protein N0F65_007835 [Lagenidium giganteum]